jgi:large subunit ribosomal protein L30
MAAVASVGGGHLKVTQVRSAIGTKPKHRGTLRALGLGGIGQSNVLPDRPEIRGMLSRVPHLVVVETTEQAPSSHPRRMAQRVRKEASS